MSDDPFYKFSAEIRRQIYNHIVIDAEQEIPIVAMQTRGKKKWLYFFNGYRKLPLSLYDTYPRLYDHARITSEKAALENFRRLSLVSKVFHEDIPEIIFSRQRYSITLRHDHVVWPTCNGPITRNYNEEMQRVQIPDHIMDHVKNANIIFQNSGPYYMYIWTCGGYIGSDPYDLERYEDNNLRDAAGIARRGIHHLTTTQGQPSLSSDWGVFKRDQYQMDNIEAARCPEDPNHLDATDHSVNKHELASSQARQMQKGAIWVSKCVLEHMKSHATKTVSNIREEMRNTNARWSKAKLDRILDAIGTVVEPEMVHEWSTQAREMSFVVARGPCPASVLPPSQILVRLRRRLLSTTLIGFDR